MCCFYDLLGLLVNLAAVIAAVFFVIFVTICVVDIVKQGKIRDKQAKRDEEEAQTERMLKIVDTYLNEKRKDK